MILRFPRLVARFFRGRDLNLHAAAVTFYGGIAVVPVALLTVRLAGLIAGADRVRHLAAPVIAAMPDRLGAGRATAALVSAGLGMSWVLMLAALVPATLYGEGLRRAFVSLAPAPAPPARPSASSSAASPGGAVSRGASTVAAGWRGRVLVLPLLAAGPVLLLALLAALPGAARLLEAGGWSSVGAVVLSFLAVWLVLSPVLIWVYRVVAPLRPAWPPTVLVGSFTAANLSGFAHGFVLFWSLPLDLGVPFGGMREVGAVVAVALWLYLLHLVTLVGYAATIQVHRMGLLRSAAG
ncbi:YihY/virulence factor BrkB family protein [Dactylosporangium roseum]|uniref:YihY/virulence factor BrkB family protein n=1 Tax=Dactylosporangium roseum TaxID=47989 RepID=A0ABY5Z9Q4_9ACTN|nr:YihY/virulence factor BrkB family protein [Dactylosporangium roseum]UWZ38597.1 YihY/virulence factor BrkB family protein [Dactylosporangium roseum]